jgi:hypothetical protein
VEAQGKRGIEPRSKSLSHWRTVRPGSADRTRWAARTVRQGTADCLHPCRGLSGLNRGPSGLNRGPSVNANRTSSGEPRKTDHPRGARGLSARHPRTVRPLLRTVRNFFQPKLKITTDRNERRARIRRTPDEHVRRGPSARTPRTVREARTEQKTHDPESQLPQIIIGFPKRLKL